MTEKAIAYSYSKHAGQYRQATGMPYLGHLFDVTNRVAHYCLHMSENVAFGVLKDELLTATMGHDWIEDTDATFEEIEKEFGVRVALLVLECTRQDGHESREQKWDFLVSFKRKSLASLAIKIADRYSNVMDYRRTPNKEVYASQYALQAYPLYRAYLNSGETHPIVMEDLYDLQEIISEKYHDISLFSDNHTRMVHGLVT
jgi:guanosine-3',5'-bis(diphosphate) 3'-pyrophosphohydrolase